MKKLILLLFLIQFTEVLIAQELIADPIDFQVSKVSIPEALKLFSKEIDIPIAFSSRFFDAQKKLSLQYSKQDPAVILERILKKTGITYRYEEDQLVLFRIPISEQKFTISGYLEDASTGEELIGASIYSLTHQKGTYTNEYGFFSLTLTGGETDLAFNYLGSGEVKRSLMLNKPVQLRIPMYRSIELEEVVVTEVKDGQDVLDQSPAVNDVNQIDVENTPAMAGEPDVLRIAQQGAGVQSGVDGFGGMFVRGGRNDQNLMLLDGVPLYNANHLFEFFSVYNATAIRSAKLLKGGFSARYGGRLSSVFDVRTREGNQKRWSAEAGLGLISGKATIEGPFAKGKGAILATARHSTFDVLFSAINETALSDNDEGEHTYRFYDVNVKLNYTFSNKDKVFLSYYHGRDLYDYLVVDEGSSSIDSENIRVKWGNQVVVGRWNHLFGDKLFLNTTLSYNKYEYDTDLSLISIGRSPIVDTALNEVNINAGIEDISAHLDWEYHPSSEHVLRFGAGVLTHQFIGEAEVEDNYDAYYSTEFSIPFYETAKIRIPEWYAYLEDDWSIGKNWRVNAGIRASAFDHPEAFYLRWEPRLSLHAKASRNNAFHASVNRMVQYLQLVDLYSVGTLDDIWIPSDSIYQPAQAWQFAFGYSYKGNRNYGWQFQTEVYYRLLDNLILNGNELDLEDEGFFNTFAVGEGEAYGWEVSLEKRSRRWRGMVNYTLAWSKWQYDVINNGEPFNAAYDRRHTFNLSLTYKINKWLSGGCNWTYGSPYPIISVSDSEVIVITPQERPSSERVLNSFRSAAYHRMDLNFTMKFQEHQIKVGVYNLYGRDNPAFHRIRNVNNQEVLDPVSLIGFLPSLYYSFRI